MTIHKSKMQRQVRDHKQERKFFIVLGIITVLLIIFLYLFFG